MKKKQPRTAAKKAPAKAKAKPMTKMAAKRADFGKPIDGWFKKQPQPQRAIAEALRKLVDEVVPEATASLKWGMPFYTLDGSMMCAIAAFKSHVNLILAGPPGAFDDPEGLLEGDAKVGRHIKLRALDDVPGAAIRGWLRTAASLARQ